VKAGDVIYSQSENNQWSVIKLLEIDQWEDGSETFHCLSYELLSSEPSLNERDLFKTSIWHSPIDGSEFRNSWQVLCSEELQAEELIGFHHYLKHTDFPRYLAVTDQDAAETVSKANKHYQKALVLSDEGKIDEAIATYSAARDLFPLFFEATNNMAFLYMDKGEYAIALLIFDESLRVNPNGFHAFFSRGECLMKLERYDEAQAVCLAGIQKFPEQQEDFLSLLERVKAGK